MLLTVKSRDLLWLLSISYTFMFSLDITNIPI